MNAGIRIRLLLFCRLCNRQTVTCIVRCRLHCSRATATRQGTELPEFNHGLSGKAKSSRNEWSRQANKQQIQTQGEVLFGIHPVTLALTANHREQFYSVYIDRKHQNDRLPQSVKNILQLAAARGVHVEFVHKNTLNYLAGNRPHQAVCLDVSPRIFPLCEPCDLMQSVALSARTVWLLPYNVQDPMNFGAILRSSYFFGVDKLIVPKENSCAASPVVSKASAGALEVMDVTQIDSRFHSLKQFTQLWQLRGGQVVGTAGVGASDSRPIYSLRDYAVSAPTLLIVGNEGKGIDSDVLDLCDTLLTITPSSPTGTNAFLQVGSLNVSVATGILLHWLRNSTQLK